MEQESNVGNIAFFFSFLVHNLETTNAVKEKGKEIAIDFFRVTGQEFIQGEKKKRKKI